jgi:RNA recognition motif-containing protein
MMQPIDLYVSNLDPVAILDDDDLAAVFRQFGTVIGAKLAIDANGTSLGVGFVRMGSPQEAEHARLQMQGRGERHAVPRRSNE